MTESETLTLFALPSGMDYGGLHETIASEFRAASTFLEGTMHVAKLVYSKSQEPSSFLSSRGSYTFAACSVPSFHSGVN